MKNLLFLLFITPAVLHAQWTTSSTNIYNSNTGNVGIGTTTPGQKLEINGNILLRNSTGLKSIYTWDASDANWRIGTNSTTGFTRALVTSQTQFLTYAASSGQGFAIGVNGGNSGFELLGSNHQAYFRGNVGIGTTSIGSYKLAVAGKIAAVGEVKVFIAGTTTFPDYVFKPNYKLTPLADVEKFIKENGHLPEVPSAEEVEQEGLSLNEMSIILLKKVEEMTLHLIELKKENELLKTRLKKLENE